MRAACFHSCTSDTAAEQYGQQAGGRTDGEQNGLHVNVKKERKTTNLKEWTA